MQKIYIKNFFAIHEAELIFDQVLLLIGEQASGKSTIAKLVYFFKSLRDDLLYLIYDQISAQPPSSHIHNQFLEQIGKKFFNFFGSTKHLTNFEITYHYSDTKSITLYLGTKDKNLKIRVEENFRKQIFFQDLRRLMSVMQQYSGRKTTFEILNFDKAVKDLALFFNDLFEDHRSLLFIPAGRNISVSFNEQFRLAFFGNIQSDLTESDLIRGKKSTTSPHSVDLFLMRNFLEYTQSIKERFRDQGFLELINNQTGSNSQLQTKIKQLVLGKISSILHGEYKHDQYGEKLYYSDQNFVYLSNASAGQQESIRILQDLFLIIIDHENAFRVIEEPEAHLYPMAQKHLIELAAIMLNRTDSQVIVTTHSPYILSVFNNLLYATRIASINPTVQKEIETTIPLESWLNPALFHAYAIKDGGIQSIIDQETGLIDQNFLDEISEKLGDEFDMLYSLHAKTVR